MIHQELIGEKRITIATLFTFLRIILTPFIVVALFKNYWRCAGLLFACAGITDFLDGFFARYFNQHTLFGACLDPVADKFLMISCFFVLTIVKVPSFNIPQWFFLVVFVKELIMIGGIIYIYCKQGFIVIKPTILGKIATAAQIFFINFIFLDYSVCGLPVNAYYIMLTAVFLLVGFSFVDYIHIGMNVFKEK